MQATFNGGQRPTTPEQKQLQQLLAKESRQLSPVKLGILLLLFAGLPYHPKPIFVKQRSCTVAFHGQDLHHSSWHEV